MPKFIWNSIIGRTGFLCASVALVLMTLGSFPVQIPNESELDDKSPHTNHVRRYRWRRRYGRRRYWRRYRRRRYYNRRIVIDLSQQRLYAWQGRRLIYSFRISTGKRSTPTPRGRFRIRSKHRYNRMRGRGYDIPNVPYAMYFYRGYAIHGAFWHNRFGTPVSHGCVNLRVHHARRLFRWATHGTTVLVRR
ncbi:MAG: L,D-transpeptidase [Calothrix sp. MO_192.B10]|nr:L,D-transpeptidase [Calothrix sp. MO_192.B10]